MDKDITNIPIKAEKKRKGKFSKFVFPIVLVFILGLAYAGYRVLEFSNSIGVKINAGDVIQNITKEPELKKDSTSKYTTALIVGIDTRSGTSKLLNTDSMIIATYNYDTKNITMVSVPRDLYIKVPGESWNTKINAIYAHGEALKKGDGINYLARTLTEVTGIEIQYKAMVDLSGFIKIIDAVGGVTVNVENTFTDYMYPTEQKGKPIYETVTFKKGPQVMDGETALKYSRSRHASGIEGSDFMRARRQQKVITALKDKIVSTDTLLNPQKVMEILAAIQDNVKLYGIETDDIQAGINLAKDYQKDPGKSYSFVLDPYFGNSQVIVRLTNIGNLYAIGAKAGVSNYTEIKALAKLCLTKPGIYSENPKIRIYNTGLGADATKAKYEAIKKKYPYLTIIYAGTLYSNKTGTVVYAHESGFSESVTELAKYLNTTTITKPDYITTGLNGEDVTILFGKVEQTATTNQ